MKMGRLARCIDAPRCAVGREERRMQGSRDGQTRRWMNEKKKSHPPWRPKAMGERRPVAKGSAAAAETPRPSRFCYVRQVRRPAAARRHCR